jgi:hypothetical protein
MDRMYGTNIQQRRIGAWLSRGLLMDVDEQQHWKRLP